MEEIKYKIVSLLPVYNEEKYLPRKFENTNKFCSDIFVYDDASTDSSLDILKKNLPADNIIIHKENAHHLESSRNAQLWDRFRSCGVKPDWVFLSGIDEFLPDWDGLIPELNSILDFAVESNAEVVTWNHAELYLNEHWYRTDAKYSQISFARLLKYKEDVQFSKEQIVEHAHCTTFPDYYTKKSTKALVVPPHIMMTLHYGYVEAERILRRYEKMAIEWENGRFAPQYIYYNWLRGVDLRSPEWKHLPKKWTNCNKGGCKPPEFDKECLVPEDNKYYYLWEKFKNRKFTEGLE